MRENRLFKRPSTDAVALLINFASFLFIMSAESKTEVVVDGNGSPDFGEGQIALDINHGTSQDEMDMHRLGRKQELSVCATRTGDHGCRC